MKQHVHFAAAALLTCLTSSASAQGLELSGASVEIKPAGTATEPPKAAASTPDPAAPKPAKAPTEIIAREASLDNKNHIAIFTGEVDVKDPQFNVDCDKLTLFLKKPQPAAAPSDPNAPKTPAAAQPKTPAKPAPKTAKDDSGTTGTGNIEKAIAEGNVIIVQDKPDAEGKPQHYTGKGKKAVYEPDKKTCTLTGWPRVAQTVNGTMNKEIISKEEGCVIIMNQDGRIDVHGYHITRLIDASALEGQTPKREAKSDQPASLESNGLR